MLKKRRLHIPRPQRVDQRLLQGGQLYGFDDVTEKISTPLPKLLKRRNTVNDEAISISSLPTSSFTRREQEGQAYDLIIYLLLHLQVTR